ncbi:MAG: hypothetical protein V3R45_09225 [Candidatus Aminicenantaceae bacterium]
MKAGPLPRRTSVLTPPSLRAEIHRFALPSSPSRQIRMEGLSHEEQLQLSRMDVEKCVSARSFSEEWRHTS